jgi:hypothetical protein
MNKEELDLRKKNLIDKFNSNNTTLAKLKTSMDELILENERIRGKVSLLDDLTKQIPNDEGEKK